MAKFNVVDMNGQHVSEIELSDAVFGITPVSYTHLRAHETLRHLVCRLLLEKKNR